MTANAISFTGLVIFTRNNTYILITQTIVHVMLFMKHYLEWYAMTLIYDTEVVARLVRWAAGNIWPIKDWIVAGVNPHG